jgi:glycosyltransferase involved in cell wall biosynthesis
MAWALRRRAHRVVAVSETARRHYLDMAGLRPERTITLYNGIELSRFATVATGTREAVRKRLGIPADAPVAVTVAVLREPKGIQHMIRALPAVLEAVPDAHYLVVGDGPHRAALEEEADLAGVVERVVFAGASDDVPSSLAAGDVFVLPSLTEALPTVIAEAGAAGLPIVATAVGGIPEMVSPGDSGLLVPPGDEPALAEAVARLLANPRLAAGLGRSGRRAAFERFDIKARAAELAAEYRHLAATRGSR